MNRQPVLISIKLSVSHNNKYDKIKFTLNRNAIGMEMLESNELSKMQYTNTILTRAEKDKRLPKLNKITAFPAILATAGGFLEYHTLLV